MKRGLILAAFIATLVLDMGAGPVFIVYASLNLNKNASFPAATWLLARGIYSVVQFITVMSLCVIVNRIKRYYSRKEEYNVVANLLATHPVAFFYYTLLIGGVVWNTLGSCWIKIAFQDYSKSFGVCYLVCIVISWTSTVLSPTFVFCGGLVYSRKKSYVSARGDENASSDVLIENGASTDIKEIMASLNGVGLSVDEILWRERFLTSFLSVPRQLSTHSQDDHPVVVTNLTAGNESSNAQPNPLLAELTRELKNPGYRKEEVIVIHRDSLDDEEDSRSTPLTSVGTSHPPSPQVRPAESPQQRSVEVSQQIRILVPVAMTPVAETTTPPVKQNLHQPKTTRKPKSSRQRLVLHNPKDHIVNVDEVINVEPTKVEEERFSVSSFCTTDEYIDISQEMIDKMNQGDFMTDGKNQNVSVTYFH